MPKVPVNVRVDKRTLRLLKEIAFGRGEKYLSTIVREALQEYISSYTGEPTLKGLEKRVKEIDHRLKKLEDRFAEILS